MNALADRITEVQRQHVKIWGDGWASTNWKCFCGWAGLDTDHAAHAAERIAAELQPEQDRQLTEARQAGFNEGMKRR